VAKKWPPGRCADPRAPRTVPSRRVQVLLFPPSYRTQGSSLDTRTGVSGDTVTRTSFYAAPVSLFGRGPWGCFLTPFAPVLTALEAEIPLPRDRRIILGGTIVPSTGALGPIGPARCGVRCTPSAALRDVVVQLVSKRPPFSPSSPAAFLMLATMALLRRAAIHLYAYLSTTTTCSVD
jgi:hypothetical protein